MIREFEKKGFVINTS
jgi:hypothetical protein